MGLPWGFSHLLGCFPWEKVHRVSFSGIFLFWWRFVFSCSKASGEPHCGGKRVALSLGNSLCRGREGKERKSRACLAEFSLGTRTGRTQTGLTQIWGKKPKFTEFLQIEDTREHRRPLAHFQLYAWLIIHDMFITHLLRVLGVPFLSQIDMVPAFLELISCIFINPQVWNYH